MTDAAHDAKIYLQAAKLNREDPLLHGSLLRFPPYGQLVMTGDLHGHRRNFERIQTFCNLQQYAARHVIIHEIVHQEIASLDARDDSHRVLLDCARWKCEFPEQVHFLMGNHELAQLQRHEITKNGRVVIDDFDTAVREDYGQQGDEVLQAINQFIATMPLAGRSENRVMVSHSLPSPRMLPAFDQTLLFRKPTPEDLSDHGSAHMLVWGRYHTEAVLQKLSGMMDVDFFICGHQPQETGYDILHDKLIILASDHNHGAFMTLDLNKPVTLEKLTNHIHPLASIA